VQNDLADNKTVLKLVLGMLKRVINRELLLFTGL